MAEGVDQVVKIAQCRIASIRGMRVILDADLASLYGVSTFHLNQAVKRNTGRFQDDFAFRLEPEEKAEVITNRDDLTGLKFSPNLPMAFTEHGVIAAAFVLRSPKAVEVSRLVVRAFVESRQRAAAGAENYQVLLDRYEGVISRVEELERRMAQPALAYQPQERPAKQPESTKKGGSWAGGLPVEGPDPVEPPDPKLIEPTGHRIMHRAKPVVGRETVNPVLNQLKIQAPVYQGRLIEHLQEHREVSYSAGDIRYLLGIPMGSTGALKQISDTVRRHLLDPLIEKGLVVCEGDSLRGKRYMAGEGAGAGKAVVESPIRQQLELLKKAAAKEARRRASQMPPEEEPRTKPPRQEPWTPRTPMGLADLKAAAQAKGGECTSPAYLGRQGKHRFRCTAFGEG